MLIFRSAVLVTCFVFVSFAACEEGKCVPRRYNTTASRVERKINVHLIPHTHDDTGWLKTVDQYYFGSRQDIQLAGVQYVLDTVIYALLANPDRKFAYAEMSFFTRWWSEQTEEHQETVKKLVANGQLSFINGGWVQHDEAAAHYVAMIDQTTRGHRFLNATFGFRPRVGWQIDPFGHSSTQASLMAGFLGFDGLFFGRSDYQDLERRKRSKELEMLWRGAKSYGKEADIFTGTFPTGNYGPPAGFYFDWGNWDAPVQDNICFVENNVKERVDDFVKAAEDMAAMYQDDDIFWPMGTDFTYSNAFTWYKNMDKLIHYVNLDGRVNAFYSTADAYVDAKHSFNASWPLKTDDFFPYADCPSCMWTGYFVSRASSKGYIRQGTSYLQAARLLELLTNTSGYTDSLEEAVSLLQHHDSITGTEKQHVANDYHKRLASAWAHAEKFVSKALSHLVYNEGPVASTESEEGQLGLHPDQAEQDDRLLLLHQCQQLNVSVCEVSMKLSQKKDPYLVVAYNPLAWRRQAAVSIPIVTNSSVSWSVEDHKGREVASQIVPVSNATKLLQHVLHDNGALPLLKHAADDELAFLADIPPLGYASYKVRHAPAGESSTGTASASLVVDWTSRDTWNSSTKEEEQTVTMGNSLLNLTFSPSSGRVRSFRTRDGKEVELELKGAWYNSSDANGPGDQGPPSGAYIFRPNGIFEATGPIPVTTIDGPVVTEIRQTLLNFLTVVTRLWKDQNHAEVEWTAGPIPIADGMGKEIVLKYQTNLSTGSTFYTDANGREMQERVLDHRQTWDLNVTEPIAGNFYPLTAAIAVKDDKMGELSVLVDRAQGGTSLRSGEIEVMLHRRTLLDDSRGVAEPLNETVASCLACESPGLIVRGKHLLAIERPDRAAAQRRQLQQLINDPILVAFGPLPIPPSKGSAITGHFSALHKSQKSLPENVHLLTSKVLEDGRILLRLAHLFQVDENAGDLTKSVTVDLNKLFEKIQFDTVEELGLAGAQPLDTIQRLEWREGHAIDNAPHSSAPFTFTRGKPIGCLSGCSHKALSMDLSPMEIRTFLLTPSDNTSQQAISAS